MDKLNIIIQKEATRMKAKYEPLEIYLQNKSGLKQEVNLSFSDIETIIGAQLPPSAKKYREWWSNQKDISNRPQAKAWINAGYVVDSVQQKSTGGSVCFRRK